MNICEHLSATAQITPDKEALVFEGRRFSYAQLDSMAAATAQLISDAGVNQGDRVAIMLPNVPAFIVCYFAIQRIGAIAVSLSTRLTGAEVAILIKDCEAKVFIGLEETHAAVCDDLPDCIQRAILSSECGDEYDGSLLKLNQTPTTPTPPTPPVATEPNDAAVILYTSGTTGFAKGATLSHINVRSNVHAFNHLCNMQPQSRILLAVPMFHCFGQNALLNSAFNVGATLILQRHFDPVETKELIQAEQVTQLYGVPMMFQLLHESCEPQHLASVSYCFSAAATLPIQTATRWQEKFHLPINEGYGLTETSPFASYNHRIKFMPGSIGTPIDNVEMKIIDTQTGRECPPGELGEIAIRGPNVMLGYWNRPEETAAAIKEGWFHSGDIGRQDESGYFFIVDRVKDMISVGGQKVFPAEVERVLLDQPAVSQVAVVGLPDDVFGEKVVAFVVGNQPLENEANVSEQLKRATSQVLAGYKVPRELMFIDELPRNPSGKILKRALRETGLDNYKRDQPASESVMTETDANVSPLSSVSRTSIPPTLRARLKSAYASSRKQIANQFVQGLVKALTASEETVAPETRFLDAGLDSLMIVEMSTQIQAEVGSDTEIPSTLVFDHPRVMDLSDFLLTTICNDDPSQPNSTRHA